MDAKKRKRLEAAGWQVGTAAQFLKLTPAEATLVEMRVALSQSLKERRLAEGLTQAALAKELGRVSRGWRSLKRAIPASRWNCSSAPCWLSARVART